MLKTCISSNKRKGMTIVEVLFSAVIVVTVMIGVLAVIIHTVTISKLIDHDYTATNIAKTRLERARSLVETSGFSALTNADFGETDTRLDWDGAPDASGDFRRSTTVATSHGGNARLTEVEVEVEYNYRGTWKEDAAITMTTLFPNIE